MSNKYINLGVRPCANESGLHHEIIQIMPNELGQITDLLNTPISGNPPTNHGHVWNLNTPNPGIRYPNPYESNKK
ncbi:MAG: hypothetical protein V9G20_15930 [Candidatus Promineifilaceae bacterium]